MSQDPPSAANPFLAPNAYDRLPPFDALDVSHIEPGIRALTERVVAGFAEVEASATPTWKGTIAALEALTEPLFSAWGVVQHLMGVKNSPELRAAHDAVQKDVVQASMRIAQSEPLYRAMLALKEGPVWSQLDRAQQRIVAGALREAELSGVGLSGAPKQPLRGPSPCSVGPKISATRITPETRPSSSASRIPSA